MKHIKQQHFNYQAPPQGSGLFACSSGTCLVPDFKGLDSADAINLTEEATHQKEISLNYLVCKLGGLLVLLALGMMPTPKGFRREISMCPALTRWEPRSG